MCHPSIIIYRDCISGTDWLSKAVCFTVWVCAIGWHVEFVRLQLVHWGLADWWGKKGERPVCQWWVEGGSGGNDGGMLDLRPEWWLPVCPACLSRLQPLSEQFKEICRSLLLLVPCSIWTVHSFYVSTLFFSL